MGLDHTVADVLGELDLLDFLVDVSVDVNVCNLHRKVIAKSVEATHQVVQGLADRDLKSHPHPGSLEVPLGHHVLL